MVDSFSADDMPVRAARVSHAAEEKTGADVEKDDKLMSYLVDHKHWSPFEHMSATFLVECPIYIAREFMRHKSLSFNEVSARYTSNFLGEVHLPRSFRKQADKNKQASAGDIDKQFEAQHIVLEAYGAAMRAYKQLQELGVAREQARMVMPVGHMTKFYATGNMRSWKHFCDLRISPDAQKEIQDVAEMIKEELVKLYPRTAKAMGF
jgi:thymidylate synthase (FAD)